MVDFATLNKFLDGKGPRLLVIVFTFIVLPLLAGIGSALYYDLKKVLAKWLFAFIISSTTGSAVLIKTWSRATAPKIYNVHERAYVLLVSAWTLESFCAAFWYYMLFPGQFIFFLFIQFTVLYDCVRLSECKLQAPIYLTLIGHPTSIIFTFSLLTVPIIGPALLFKRFYLSLALIWVLLLISLLSLYITLKSKDYRNYSKVWINMEETSKPVLDSLVRHKDAPPKKSDNVLRIVQITDVHIGPVMSVDRLKYICYQAVALQPDLIVLTGDFYTVQAYGEGYDVPSNSFSLKAGLAPLKNYASKCVACLGNHDKEGAFALSKTKSVLEELGIQLLIDKEAIYETRLGKVQIVGLDFRKSKEPHTAQICKKYPKNPAAVLRLVLLHDPSGFKFVPVDDDSLVLSGHTHGGQVGWIYGFSFTLSGLIMPDHGLWGYGKNRLYVHRGQGCRSLLGTAILRVGVPPEDSVLNVNVNPLIQKKK